MANHFVSYVLKIYFYATFYLISVIVAYPLSPYESDAPGRISPFVAEYDPKTRPDLGRRPPSPGPSTDSSSLMERRQRLQYELDAISKQEVRSKAIAQLLDVFGVRNTSVLPHGEGNRITPPFMMNLYNSVADSSSGLTFARSPFNANTIRSLPDKARRSRMHFQFNLSKVDQSELLLQAELHLFRLKPRWKSDVRRPSFFQIHVYQLMSPDVSSIEGARLIGLRLMAARGTGWEIFSIRDTVQDWLRNTSCNFGLHVTVTSLSGEPLQDNLIRFAKRGRHQDSRQPILVLFTDDLRHRKVPRPMQEDAPDNAYESEGMRGNAYDETSRSSAATQTMEEPTISTVIYHRSPTAEESLKRKRSLAKREAHMAKLVQPATQGTTEKTCGREMLYVDFNDIGWSSWIVAPAGYQAYHCTGRCPFPLGVDYRPSNHATVQSILNAISSLYVAPPCCVPAELHPITVLYFDFDENVVLKKIDDMVVGNCGCH